MASNCIVTAIIQHSYMQTCKHATVHPYDINQTLVEWLVGKYKYSKRVREKVCIYRITCINVFLC